MNRVPNRVMCFGPSLGSLFLAINHTLGDLYVLRHLTNVEPNIARQLLAVPFILTALFGHPVMVYSLVLFLRRTSKDGPSSNPRLNLGLKVGVVLWIVAHLFAGLGDLGYAGTLIWSPGVLTTFVLTPPGLVRGVSSGVILVSGGLLLPILLLVFFSKTQIVSRYIGPGFILVSILFSIMFRVLYQVEGHLVYLLGFVGALIANSLGLFLTARSYLGLIFNEGALVMSYTETGVRLVQGYSREGRMYYLMTFPPEQNMDPEEPYPLIVFLHSLEERGKSIDLLIENPAGQGQGLAGFALANPEFPYATLSPLCPKGSFWSFLHRRLAALVREVLNTQPIQSSQVFLSGVSMGGIGTWSFAMAYPEFFSGLIPISGGVYTPPIIPRYRRIVHLPVFAYHDREDPSIPFQVAEKTMHRFQEAGGQGTLVEFTSGDHYIQIRVFDSFVSILESFRVE
jgi:hypothetical protein